MTKTTIAAQPDNPLLDFSGLTRFDAIVPEHVTPAVDVLLAAARAAVAAAADPDAPVSWETIVEPLDEASDRLGRAWNAVAHMNAVVDTPQLRAQYNNNLPRITAFWTELSQNETLYKRFKALAALPGFDQWPAARRRIVENELRDFRLGGAELDDASKPRFRQLRERQAQVETRFAENVLDATQAFTLYIADASALAGVPEDSMRAFREAAEADGRTGYKVTLQYPSYSAVLDYADDRALREELYRAYVTRASEFGNPSWNNGPLIVELLQLRGESARLLGYASHADVSLVTKMAQSSDDVLHFLRDLAQRARLYAQRDLRELREFAAQELGIGDLQPWDFGYVSEKLREARYAYSEQELRAYFTLPRVLAGLFRVIETLFGVAIHEDQAPTWHPDVRVYRINRADGALVGQFYLDLYARDNKQGGAWQDSARSRMGRRAMLETPVSYLTCNFARPAAGRPATLRHDEVLTLFHEFGHGLHHLLTQVDEPSVSGIRGVEWDAVELPSQFMENFAWEWEPLQLLTAHADSGEPLPRELFDRIIAARHFQTGYYTMRQIEFALFDMLLHAAAPPPSDEAVLALLRAVRQEVAVLPPPEYNRFPHAFSHIFAGGYAAGYYSYKWAEVLSADAYAAFEEAGGLDPEVGGRFRDEILAVGGSRPAMQSFIAFRGRKPSIDALLRHHGMTN
jgi:oligopeptidase A